MVLKVAYLTRGDVADFFKETQGAGEIDYFKQISRDMATASTRKVVENEDGTKVAYNYYLFENDNKNGKLIASRMDENGEVYNISEIANKWFEKKFEEEPEL